MPLEVDLTRFRALIRDIAKYRNKSEAEVLNKGLTTAIIGSSKYKGIVQLAPKATAGKIRADLKNNNLNVRLAVARLKKEGYFNARHSRAEIQQKIASMCDATLTKRLKSRAYIAAGWIKALQDLGVLTKGARETRFWAGGTAADGYGVKATTNSLVAKAFSMSRGSETVLEPYMQQAVEGAAEDMADYFRQKLGGLFARLSRQSA